MAKYKITAPDGNSYAVTAPDTASQDEVLAYAKSNYQKAAPQSMLQQARPALQQFDKSQIGSPQQMLGMVPGMLSRLAGRAGQGMAENLGAKGVNPYVSAALGTAAAIGPDVAMTAANPTSEVPNSIPEAAIPMQRRAYGFSKALLKTPFARGKAAMAARTGLEQGVTSAMGNPDVMMSKANDLAAKTGQKLGNIRSSVGPQPIDHFVDALDNYKAGRLRGASGGKWDAISNKIDEAKETILGILGKQEKEKPAIHIPGSKNIEEQESMAQHIPGTKGSPGTRNPATGFIEGEIPETPGRWIGGNRTRNPATGFQENITTETPGRWVGGKRGDPVMGIFGPPDKVDLNRIAEAKKEIGKIVNWFADNVGQAETKKITGVIEKATEQAIAGAGGDIKQYKALKPIYGAMKSIQKGLNNEIAAQQGNMAVSLPSQIVGGAGAAATGHLGGALKATGVSELLRRRGAGIGASEMVGAANAPKNFGAPFAQALQALRRKKREDPNSQQ